MTRWRCRSYRRLLVEHVEGTLVSRQREALEQHLTQCARCTEALRALRELPAVLRTSVIPDPGEAFWRQQRQAIGRALRTLPEPRAGRWPAWWPEGWRGTAWQYPLALAASLLVALLIYRLAQRPQALPPGALPAQLAALDTDSLVVLHEMMQALVAPDEEKPGADDEDAVLAALPAAEIAEVPVVPEVPRTHDLSESELEGIDGLVGDLS